MFFLLFWFFLTGVFLSVPVFYYWYTHTKSTLPWNITIGEPEKWPELSMIIPSFNEEKTIYYKLKNINRIDYPQELINYIIVDSASTDGTQSTIKKYIKENKEKKILFIQEKERKGKSQALKKAINKVNTEFVIVSDSDCFLSPNIIKESLKYMHDDQIFAVAAEESILNKDQTAVTRQEVLYREKMTSIRLGESKIHSTIRFEGGYAIYRKKALSMLDEETGADDSGTALNIVQSGGRTILVPEIKFYTFFPLTIRGKINIKLRRANHLIKLWIKCLNLLLSRKLLIPKKIAIPEIFLHIINPVLFVIISMMYLLIIYLTPIFTVILIAILVIPVLRTYFFETVINYSILFLALIGALLNKQYIIWNKLDENRDIFDISLLEKNNLL